MSQIQKAPEQIKQKHDEHILVVKRHYLFGKIAAWSGIKAVDLDHYLDIMQQEKEFLPRSLMEQDPHYKQIIPYLVFCHNDKYFLMQRTDSGGEARLHNKFSLGIGGHVRQEDLVSNSIFDWAKREFHEEIDYADDFEIQPLGVLNDDSNAVGQVHIGFVFLLKGSTDAIKIRSELKDGKLLTLEECRGYFDRMEPWSQFVFEFLTKQSDQ